MGAIGERTSIPLWFVNTARNAGIQVYNKPPNLEKQRRSKGAVAKEHQATGRPGPPRPRTIKVAPIPGRSQARRDSVRPKLSLSSPLSSRQLSLWSKAAPPAARTHARLVSRLAAQLARGGIGPIGSDPVRFPHRPSRFILLGRCEPARAPEENGLTRCVPRRWAPLAFNRARAPGKIQPLLTMCTYPFLRCGWWWWPLASRSFWQSWATSEQQRSRSAPTLDEQQQRCTRRGGPVVDHTILLLPNRTTCRSYDGEHVLFCTLLPSSYKKQSRYVQIRCKTISSHFLLDWFFFNWENREYVMWPTVHCYCCYIRREIRCLIAGSRAGQSGREPGWQK